MESFGIDSKRIVIKPGKVYWFPGILSIAAGFLYHWGMSQAQPTDNPRADKMAVLLSFLIPVFIGLLHFLYCVLKRIIIDETGITSGVFLTPRKHYSWSEITNAYIIREAVAYPCKVYAGEKLIAKVPRAFNGYESLLYELEKRKIIQEDDLYEVAMGMVILDKIKLRDFFKKDTEGK